MLTIPDRWSTLEDARKIAEENPQTDMENLKMALYWTKPTEGQLLIGTAVVVPVCIPI